MLWLYWLPRECGSVQERDHLGSQTIARRGDVGDRSQVVVVGRVIARDRAIGIGQTGKAQLANRRGDLLIDLSQVYVLVAVRNQIGRDKFHQHATIADVIVRQSQQRQDGRPHIGVIGEYAVVSARARHPRAGHAEPGGRDVRLNVAMVPGKRRTRRRRNEHA